MNKPYSFSTAVMVVMINLLLLTTVGVSWGQTYKIMPLGDSITSGTTGSTTLGGYRDDLKTLLTDELVTTDFVGSLSNGTFSDPQHEGHEGATVESLNNNVTSWVTTAAPQYVLLNIGTNDLGTVPIETIAAKISSICDKIYDVDSGITVFLSSILPRGDSTSKDSLAHQLNKLIKQVAVDKFDAGFNIYYVGTNELFKNNPNWTTEYMFDGLHPNDTGYNQMAQLFWSAIMNVIKQEDTIITDNFNRSEIGVAWECDPEFILETVSPGQREMKNNSVENRWDMMAVYKAVYNAGEVSIRWGINATSEGIENGGLALRLNNASKTANGYLLRVKMDGTLNLWTIVNGSPDQDIAETQITQPAAGQVFKVVLSSDAVAHHFHCYIDGTYAGTVSDYNKLRGNETELYAGVMLRGSVDGSTSLENNVDNFNFRIVGDLTPPARISNLSVASTTSSSVTLTWTAPGDDSLTDQASFYDIRYSTSVLTESNWNNATRASNIEKPKTPLSTESIVVMGLEGNKRYYFGVKVADEEYNYSLLSNVVDATTSGGTALQKSDDFSNSSTLTQSWSADPAYVIQNGELDNTSAVSAWGQLAVFKANVNPISASITWSPNATSDGIDKGALALLLDSDNYTTANGYLAWIRTQVGDDPALYLFTQKAGAPENFLGSYTASGFTKPGPGDVFKVAVSRDGTGHHFDYYVNEKFYGRLNDEAKTYSDGTDYYMGIELHGNLNNNVDRFITLNTVGAPSIMQKVKPIDPPTGIVGKVLSDSLIIRITDKSGNPISGVNVDFTVTKGGGRVDLQASDNYVRLEAEKASTLESPMEIGVDASASNSQYIVPNGGAPLEGKAEYNFYAKEAGNYVIWCRMLLPDNQRLSLFVQIDGKPTISATGDPPPPNGVWDFQEYEPGNWSWKVVTDRANNGDVASFNLTKGNHKLTITQRVGAGTKIDKILISNNYSYVPSGLEAITQYMTDSYGQARAQYTFGTVAGENRVEAMSPGYTLTNAPIIFIINGNADTPISMVASSATSQTGTGGQKLAQPFEVALKDKYNNAAANYEITFTVTEGDGFLTNGTTVHKIKSDSNGKAATYLTLGTESTNNKVVASYGSLSPITFTGAATSGIAKAMQYESGNSQSAKVGTTLSNPLKVKIVDSQGNPVLNHNVKFQVTAGGGNLVATVLSSSNQLNGKTLFSDVAIQSGGALSMDVLTSSDGIASVRLVVGYQAGVNTVQATSNTGGAAMTPVEFNATATPDIADSLIAVSGNNQSGAAGMRLSKPFVVKVTDQYANPIYGHQVQFKITAGDGYLDGNTDKTKSVLTDPEGKAQVHLTLGTVVGVVNKVTAESTPLKGSPVTFTATVGLVTSIEAKSAINHVGSAGTPLDDSLSVYVKDNYGNPVGGYPVFFSSITGDNPGTFNGYSSNQIEILTDSYGIARVAFYCGIKPAVTSTAKATATGLTGSPINYTVQVAELGELKYVDGNNQTGTVGTVLPKPLIAKIVDLRGIAIPNYDITFKVLQGGGKIAGDTLAVIKSDTTTKEAKAAFILGPTQGTNNNIVEAQAVYNGKALTGSPIRYTASSTIGEATELFEVSGNYQRSVVGSPLESPFVVIVGDAFRNPFANRQVTFTVKSGGGYLDGDSTKKTITKTTDSNGKAQVLLTVGKTSGQNNNTVEVISYKAGTQTHLTNSPMTFYASASSSAAHTLELVSGTGQARSPVRQALPQPFVVKVKDRNGNPVVDHPVQWEIPQGSGSFDGLTDSAKTVSTNAAGISQVYYYPGPLAGLQNIVRARSWNQTELNGSPRTFVVDTKEGSVSIKNSVVSATSPVLADGESKSTITVILQDDWGNKIANKVVGFLGVTGSNNIQSGFWEPADDNGRVEGYLASKKAEMKIVTIRDITDGINLEDTAAVRFTALKAHQINYVSGTDQIGNFGTALKEPIKAVVLDINGNPIAGHPVQFEVFEGGGYIWEHKTAESSYVYTDLNGVAAAYWALGPAIEVNRVRAIAEGLVNSGNVRYIATGRQGTAAKVKKHSGDMQSGTAGLPLNELLAVKVVDASDYPICDFETEFKVEYGGGSFNGGGSFYIKTDPFGQASGSFTLGRTAGSNVVSVVAPGLVGSPIGFTAQGIAGEAAKIVHWAGEGKTGPVGGRISGIQVKITDIFDNAVSGYNVNFAINEGDATISGSSSVVSGPDGIASLVINLGTTVGEVEIMVAAPGLIGDGLKIKVYAVAASAVSMKEYFGNNQQGTIERELVYPFSVIILDQHGNPAGNQNVPISFVMIQGNGVVLDRSVYANENGVASARFQLGNITGNGYKVWAINNTLSGSPIEFQATGVTNKFPTYDPIPAASVRENQSISFKVNAVDGDNEPIRYGVRNLPQGALFDSLGTKQFSWTPTYFHSGEHVIHFMAWDSRGGFDDESVNITVENVNRLPQITYYEPFNKDLVGHKNVGETFRFLVQATDPDYDELTYAWYDNDIFVASKNSYDFYVANNNIGTHFIKVKVIDGYDTVEREWKIYLKTPVQLISFSGHIVERQSIALEWETTVEVAHAGFNVFRKSTAEQEYQQINAQLIASDGTRKYRFIDRKIEVGETYSYKLEDVSISGEKTLHDPIDIVVNRPEEYQLSQNYPNPFNPTTLIEFQLPDQMLVTIKIYNILGQEVKVLVDEVKKAGYHSVVWNGLDNSNVAVTSGVYYYQMTTGAFNKVKKMVLLR